MTTIKNIATIFSLLIIFITTGCKKDKDDSRPVNPDDLLAYRFVGTFIDNNNIERLRLFYFNKNGNSIQCTTDYIATRRIHTVLLVNNSFSIDMDGDGKIVYIFKLGKREDGTVFVQSSEYKNINTPAYKSWHCDAYQASDIFSIKDLWFVGSNEYNIHFQTDTWSFTKSPAVTGTYYEVFPGAWKGSLGGVDYFGIRLKTEMDSKMIFQKNGETKLIELFED